MTWGTFGLTHFASLAAAAALSVGLYFCLKKTNKTVQIAVLGVLSFWGVGAIIFNLLMWNNPWHYLPLHLCSVNALALPVAVFSRNKTVCNLLLVWSLGALAALICNWEMTTTELVSWTFFFYYFPHVVEFAIPILLFKLGLVKKDPRCILSTLGITMAAYTLVHFANLIVTRYAHQNVNYMFSIRPENPLLALFYKAIPLSYWYMYMIFPMLVVYLLVVYLPQLLRRKTA